MASVCLVGQLGQDAGRSSSHVSTLPLPTRCSPAAMLGGPLARCPLQAVGVTASAVGWRQARPAWPVRSAIFQVASWPGTI